MPEELLPAENGSKQTPEETLLSRIPPMEGNERIAAAKADYLGFRGCGFTVRQACHLANISQVQLNRYRRDDAQFKDIETNHLPELQSGVAKDIIKMEFLQNMRMALRADFKILFKAVQTVEALTPREFAYFKKIRSLYTSQDLMALEKVLSGGADEPTDFSTMVIKLTQTRTDMEVSIAKDNNGANEEVPPVVEGECKEV